MEKKFISLFLILTLIGVCSIGQAEFSGQDIEITPIYITSIEPVTAVKLSDQKWHLVYELIFTHVGHENLELKTIETFVDNKQHDLFSPENRLSSVSNTPLSGRINVGQAVILWMDVQLEGTIDPTQLKNIKHHFLFTGKQQSNRQQTYILPISIQPMPIIESPLKGKYWVAADGCCQAHRHRRALLPLNNGLWNAQKYAIDWEKLNETDKLFEGDSKDVSNYFAYNEPVYATDNGTIVEAVNQYIDQTPGALPDNITLQEVNGNYIILKMNNGFYAYYAHLKKDSLLVKKGDKVTEGQMIARVGNTGNTTAPHLHFHVIREPSPLLSTAVPYGFKSYQVRGQVRSTRDFDIAEQSGVPLAWTAFKNPKKEKNSLPSDLAVIDF